MADAGLEDFIMGTISLITNLGEFGLYMAVKHHEMVLCLVYIFHLK